MYVRMSTDHQKYSTENQADAIRKYAVENNIEIIATYADHGKSGLTLNGRESLQRLLFDVENTQIEFSVILVLDITRWGRFQNTDEAAHHEHTCHKAGVEIHYVAEPFQNDGSPYSSLVKSIKRMMSAEYSRELSKKVHAGQCRLIRLGFRQGGPSGYGIRRMLIDERGNPKAELKPGEYKSLQTDRVILVPGPENEIETVQWMYQKFTRNGLSEKEIANTLNHKGILTDFGRKWTRGTVHQVLTNEKYIGNNVFNRTSNTLQQRKVSNPKELWVRSDGAFEAIVDPNIFQTARKIIRERNQSFSSEEMLECLHTLHEKTGWLSGIIIDEQCNMPSSGAYQYRFGSLLRAYKLIGYTPDRDYRYIEINRYLRELYSEIITDTIEKIQSLGTHVSFDEKTGLLHVNGELRVSIVIARCLTTNAGAYRWKIQFDSGLEPDISIAVRMDTLNQAPLDYYIIPSSHIKNPKVRLAQNNGWTLDAFRFDNLDIFFKLTERVIISEAA